MKTAIDPGLLSRQPQPVVAEGRRAKAEVDFAVAGSQISDDCLIRLLLYHPARKVQCTHRFAKGAGQWFGKIHTAILEAEAGFGLQVVDGLVCGQRFFPVDSDAPGRT